VIHAVPGSGWAKPFTHPRDERTLAAGHVGTSRRSASPCALHLRTSHAHLVRGLLTSQAFRCLHDLPLDASMREQGNQE